MYDLMKNARIGRRPADEEGAVAILVAILLIVLVGISAFTIDFGAAYNSKTQLQVSADAAALAAAGHLEDAGATCPIVSGTDRADALQEAMEVMADNHPNATRVAPTLVEPFVTCLDPEYPLKLVVTWRNEATTDIGLGQVFGMSELTTNRMSKVIVNPGASGGMRPLALCSAELPLLTPSMILMNFDGHMSGGGCDSLPGNWRKLDCPGQSLNSSNAYKDAIEDGCDNPILPVAGQPAPGAALTSHLLAACPDPGDSDEDCLGGSTGQVFAGQIEGAWMGLLGDTIRFPVLCASDSCPSDGAYDGTGDQSLFPVHKVVEATVCGVHRHSSSADYDVSLGCLGAPVFAGDSHDNWLVLQVLRVLEHDDPDAVSVGPGSVSLVD